MHPKFVWVELPKFRITDNYGNLVFLDDEELGILMHKFQYVRGGLRGEHVYHQVASLLYEDRTRLCNSVHARYHAEELFLLNYYFQNNSPGAYPIVDAMILDRKPCHRCISYFSDRGARIPVPNYTGAIPRPSSIQAKYTPRVDRSFTPIFYVSNSMDDEQRQRYWLQLKEIWTDSRGVLMKSAWTWPRRKTVLRLKRRRRPGGTLGLDPGYWIGAPFKEEETDPTPMTSNTTDQLINWGLDPTPVTLSVTDPSINRGLDLALEMLNTTDQSINQETDPTTPMTLNSTDQEIDQEIDGETDDCTVS
ncbi:hypothetical protein NUW58_g2863 [Xylaria curta]|uniref:Uncharacterized protein n=1 Tax=Xylaria curta TaxID=42375 RepID=A0ACC1PDJ7_9PEZI|nr:hypothetical protein NUW58_g2863 [Xylaria curta]